MTMQAISLYERVVIRRSPYLDLALPGSNVKLRPGQHCHQGGAGFLPLYGLLAGADITVYKSVPVRAGMAGGSADAAAVLVGLNELYGARLSMSELCALGVSIGADVPFSPHGRHLPGAGPRRPYQGTAAHARVLVHGGDARLRHLDAGGFRGLR